MTDPRALRRRIADLEEQLREAKAATRSAETDEQDRRAADLLLLDERLGAASSSEELLDAAFEEVVRVSGAEGAAIGLLDGDAIAFERIVGFDGKAQFWRRLSLTADAPPIAAVREAQGIYIHDIEELKRRHPALANLTTTYASRAALPLAGGSGIVGALYLAFARVVDFDAGLRPYLDEFAIRCGAAAERLLLLESAQRSERRTRGLQSVTANLAAARDVGDIGRIAAEGARDAVDAQAGGVALEETDGSLTLRAVVGSPDDSVRRAPDRVEDLGEEMRSVFATGRLVTFASKDEMTASNPSQAELIGSLPYHAVAMIPIQGQDRCLGVLNVTRTVPEPFDERELDLLLAIGAQCGIAIERARHLEERERVLQREHALQEVAAGLTRDHTVRAMADTVLAGLGLLEANRSCVGIVSADGSHLDIVAARGYDDASEPLRSIDLGEQLPISDAVRSQELMVLRSLDDARARYPATAAAMRPLGSQAAIVQPVLANERAIGCLALGFDEPLRLRPESLELLSTVARLFAQAMERARAYESELATRGALERAMSRLGRLQSVTASLTPQLRADEIAHTILREVTAAFGAEAAGLFTPSGDKLRPVMISGEGEEVWDGATEVSVDSPLAVAEAYRTGRTVWVPTPAEWRRRYPTAPPEYHAGMAAVLAVPLLQEKEVRAVLGMLFRRERTLTKEERRLATTIGYQAGQALERARLYEAERRSTRRIGELQEIAASLAAAVTPEEVADVVVSRAGPVLGAVAGSVGVIDADGRALHLLAHTDGLLPAAANTALTDPGARWPGRDAIAQRGGILLPDRDALRRSYPDLAEDESGRNQGAWATFPLLTETDAIGFLHLAFASAQSFDEDQVRELRTVAAQAAQALDRARLFAREHEVARVLQDSLLPKEQTQSARFAIATRYLPGADHLEVGGDWFDVVALPDDRLGIAVGDVVGRGLNAAASMGQLRSALRALALLGGGPVAVLDGLERFAEHTPGAEMSTVVYSELDPDGTVRYCCAGHPPPLVEVGGEVTVLEEGRSPVLAVGAPGPRALGVAVVPPGGSIVLYTDGLVERRGESIDRGIQRLARALAATTALAPDARCDEILTRLLDGVERDDDIALLCVTRTSVDPERFEATIPSDPARLSPLRHDLTSWLRARAVDARQIDDVVLATNEAVANAIEHGRRDGDAEVSVVASVHADGVRVEVRDHGGWLGRPSGPNRGRGLPLMRALMDDVTVDRRPDGTVVRLHHRIAASSTA